MKNLFEKMKAVWPKTAPSTELVPLPKYAELIDLNPKHDPNYTVEFFPYSGRYFPRYKGRYMLGLNSTGIIETFATPSSCDCYRTVEEAWKRADYHKKQQTSVTSVIIRR